MAGGLRRIVRLPRVDLLGDQEDYVLVELTSATNDLRGFNMIGTDGESVFKVTADYHGTSKLKTNSNVSQESWDVILSMILLGRAPETGSTHLTEGVEAVATVAPGKTMTLTIQKRIEGITQTIGEIILRFNENEEISLFEWCGLTTKSQNVTEGDLEVSKATIHKQQEHLKRLDKSLADLIALKNNSEGQLLEKFSLLLNEKKLKIRDQQRLLASSTVDPSKLAEVEVGRAATRERSAGPSRAGKRKAVVAAQSDSDDGSEDGFVKMEVEEEGEPSIDSEIEDQQTASETEDDDEKPSVSVSSARKPRQPSAQPTILKAQSRAEAPPPKRELPFSKKPPAPVPSPAIIDRSETEDDDDEL